MSAITQAENILQLWEKMADKSRFGPELTEAEIDALVNNTWHTLTGKILNLAILNNYPT